MRVGKESAMMMNFIHESVLKKAVKEAVRQSGVNKSASPHAFRRSFATFT
jgi:site-specific recombinase XerD